MSNVYQVWLATVQVRQNFVQKRSMDKFLLILPFLLFFYSHYAQPKDTPLQFLALT
jgi:hypothetical protein